MNKVNFAIALHFHQPVGNFDNIIKRAHDLCYEPFLKLLSEYPHIKIMMHISGCLFDYLEKNNQETIDKIKSMVQKGQIEMLTGGYYEPVLTSIPESDIKGQIKMLSDYIKIKFSYNPKGLWLAERVWDPCLIDILLNSGIEYIILDDEHLISSGVEKDKIHGYFLTGKNGNRIKIFPSDKKLRYMIPFKFPHESTEYLKSRVLENRDILLTYGDDGEKFGEWPGTHDWVYKQNWLKNFFDEIVKNSEWLSTMHFSEYLLKNKESDTVLEIKPGSYREMMEWSGGSWMNFLDKYPESKQMHDKMVYVSKKLINIQQSPGANTEKIALAKKYLYKGQCNCAYWHGVFGGLYLYHLRKAVYENLIKADEIIDSILHKGTDNWISVNTHTDKPQTNNVIAETRDFSLNISSKGGVVTELDYRPFSINIVNSLSRKHEKYHEKIKQAHSESENAHVATIHDDFRTIDPKLKKLLVYDKFSRSFFRTYFISNTVGPEELQSLSFNEFLDFSDCNYDTTVENRTIKLKRESDSGIKVIKSIQVFDTQNIGFKATIDNVKKLPEKTLFLMEFNITMPFLDSDRYSYTTNHSVIGPINKTGEVKMPSEFMVADSLDEFAVNFNLLTKPDKVCFFPVQTISQSERAYELNYQCSCIALIWNVNTALNKEIFELNINFYKQN